MSVDAITWPNWLPRVLWTRHICPRCKGSNFKPAELRWFDGLLAMFALRPVRCKFCWRRYYWLSMKGAE